MKKTKKAATRTRKPPAKRTQKANAARALYDGMSPVTQSLVAALVSVAALVEERGLYSKAGPVYPEEVLATALDALNAAFAEVGE